MTNIRIETLDEVIQRLQTEDEQKTFVPVYKNGIPEFVPASTVYKKAVQQVFGPDIPNYRADKDTLESVHKVENGFVGIHSYNPKDSDSFNFLGTFQKEAGNAVMMVRTPDTLHVLTIDDVKHGIANHSKKIHRHKHNNPKESLTKAGFTASCLQNAAYKTIGFHL